MSTRQNLADVANTVEGVTCSAYFWQSTKPGTGMVRMDRIDYPNPFGGIVTWQVILMLPQDLAAAEKWLESKSPALVEALGAEMVVRSVTPSQLAIDTGTVPVVVFEGTREE